MSQQSPELQAFVDECMQEYYNGPYEEGATRFSSEAFQIVMAVMVYQGFIVCLPLLQSWVETGATAAELKRQEIENKLKEFAKEKELDYKAAPKAAKIVAKRLTEENIKAVFDAVKVFISAKA